jgi:phage baseplate assembly protein W
MVNVKQHSTHWAYDISKDIISKGEIYDVNVINQSIESILSTLPGERLFNPNFGSTLGTYLFEHINEDSGEKILDDIISEIQRFEDRIIIVSQMASIKLYNDESAIILTIPYIIKVRNIASKFEKKINF